MNKQPLLYIFLSAVFFGISPPFAKVLVADIPPVALAGLLYAGAFLGLSLYSLARKSVSVKRDREKGDIGKKGLSLADRRHCLRWNNSTHKPDVRAESPLWIFNLVIA